MVQDTTQQQNSADSPPCLFFSDAHLGAPKLEDDPHREQQVIAFLEYGASRNADIYIVGDLFEFWFEYRHAITRHNFATLAALHRLANQGTRLHYLAGNHDIWIGEFFSETLGVPVYHQGVSLQAGSLRVHAIHGDGLAPEDRGYRLMKRVFTSRLNIALFRLIHPDLGIWLARQTSQISRNQDESKRDWDEAYRAAALDILNDGHDVVLMGHTHKPHHERVGDKHYINLGDWISHFTYCEISDNEVSLKQWPSHQVLASGHGNGQSENAKPLASVES